MAISPTQLRSSSQKVQDVSERPAASAAKATATNRVATKADGFERAPVARLATTLAPPAGQALLGGLDIGDIIRSGLNLLLGKDSTGLAGWMQRDKSLPPTRDITADFKSTYKDVQLGANPLPPEAKDYVYLTVDGLTGENWPGYMEANREGLRDKGLDVREIKVDTEASTETNAETIRKAIEKVAREGKQVVLIGHSKGGNDITAAIALHPELEEHVRAVVTMQTPYGGAPLAQDLLSNDATKLGVDALAKYVFNGDPECVEDLTYTERMDFIKKHPYPTDIPTVSLATSSTSQASLLVGPNDYTRLRYGEKTDGLVSPKDAFVPGANVVKLSDLDHLNSVMPNFPQLSHWEPGDLTVALVAMALKYPPATQAARRAA